MSLSDWWNTHQKNKLELDTKTCIICESQGCDIATVKKNMEFL